MAFFNEEVNAELDKKTGDFYKLESGKNMFRIVSDFAWGFRYNYDSREEGMTLNNPFYKINDPLVEKNRDKLVLTCAMVIYDYAGSEFKIFMVTQKNILNAIREYTDNPNYGDPTAYDLIISRTGDKKETRYQVIANPPKEFDPELKKKFAEISVNINNVYEGRPVIETV